MEKLIQYLTKTQTTREQFAADIGVRPSTVHGWLSGARRPTPQSAAAIEAYTFGQVRACDIDLGRAAEKQAERRVSIAARRAALIEAAKTCDTLAEAARAIGVKYYTAQNDAKALGIAFGGQA